MDVTKENSHRAPDEITVDRRVREVIPLVREKPVFGREHILPTLELNQSVTSVQLLRDSINKLEDLLRSVKGLTEQLEQSTQPHQKKILVSELHEVVKAVEDVRDYSSQHLVQELAQTSQDPLPEPLRTLPSAFLGVRRVTESSSQSEKEETLAVSQKEVSSLRLAVEEVEEKLRRAFTYSDVALQNEVAAKSTLRDIELAMRAAERIAEFVREHPHRTLRVFSKDLQDVILTLL